MDEQELEFITANTMIIGSQWEIYWILSHCENELQRRRNGVLNLLYFMKPYMTNKGLDETNLLDSIKFLQKENNETV